ncbi:MAG: helix-turn-helix domain-containing protein, partial [Actinomycetota bacterium]|nr:helix-turn-helix domain-containing protein [Actinomycetota bacterium]
SMQEYLADRDARIAALYTSGLTLREIARKFEGMSPSSVGNDLARLGVPRRPRGRRPKETS